VKLQAPVLGEEITVCRNGDTVWAHPGAKVEFLSSDSKAAAANQEEDTDLSSDHPATGDISSSAVHCGPGGRR
jgi:hypothetical protein